MNYIIHLSPINRKDMDIIKEKTSTTGHFTFEGIAYMVIREKQGELLGTTGRVIPVQRIVNELLRELAEMKKMEINPQVQTPVVPSPADV